MVRFEVKDCVWKILTILASASLVLTVEESTWTATCSTSSLQNTLSFIPNPEDCRKYFACIQGNAFPISCPFGLNWDPISSKCSPLYKCEKRKNNKSPTYNPLCPVDENPSYLPDNHDCGKFYECQGGFAIRMSCPDQNHWSVEHRRCEDPSVANCKSRQKAINNGQINLACPLTDDSNHPVHLPHPVDCTKFLKCSFGRSFIVSCPYGLHWNVQTERCDSPFVAQCGETAETTVPATIAPASTYQSVNPTPVEPNAIAKPITNSNIPVCPENGIKNFGIPGQCDKYFSCSQGKLYVTTCRKGRQWSEKLNGCVDSNIAGCTGLISGSLFGRATQQQKPYSLASSSITLRPQTTCTPGVRYSPHPTDCQKYIVCDNGKSVEMSCPRGLYFNRASSTCQWTNVDC